MRFLLAFFLSTLSAFGALTVSGALTISGSLLVGDGSLTAPQKATSFSPANSATLISATPTLSWNNGGGALTYDVWFDTVNPPVTKVVSSSSATTYSPSTLSYSTIYYWRIDPINGIGTTTGDVLSFTTFVPNVVDFFADFESGNNGDPTTVSILNSGSHDSTFGTWTLNQTTGQTNITVGLNQMSIFRPVQKGATVYTDSGSTRSLEIDQSNSTNFVKLAFTNTTLTAITFGVWVSQGTIGSSFIAADMIFFGSSGGKFFVTQSDAGRNMIAHAAGTAVGIATTMGVDVRYYVTGYFDLSTGGIACYDASLNLLGTSTMPSVNASGEHWTNVQLGRTDTHGGAGGGPTQPPPGSMLRFDGFRMVAGTNAYPILP